MPRAVAKTTAEAIKKATASAIVRILRPLIRVLLRSGIPFRTFAELAKWTFVDVAFKEFGLPERKQSISRVSVITGLTRKEVTRLKGIVVPDDLGATEAYNRAARVIGGWLKDPRFQNGENRPSVLPFEAEGEERSFAALVKAYSGDVPARAVLDELSRVGVVAEGKRGISLLTRGYLVREGEVEKLGIFGTDVGELISTIDHNIVCDPGEVFLQRKASYDNIPEDVHDELRAILRKMGEEFIETVDRTISSCDRDVNPSVKGKGRKKSGLAVFYFE